MPTAAADSNGKQVAINTLNGQVDTLFDRIHEIETKGCVPGQYVAKEVKDLKSEIRTIRNLIWWLIVLLAAINGPQFVAWITKGIG